MALPSHPYFVSLPTMIMGYLTGSNKYTPNPVEKSITYSFLGTSTFLMFLRNTALTANNENFYYKSSVKFIGNMFAATLLTGSYYCMGHLLGLAKNKRSENQFSEFKNLIENKPLQ